MNKKKVECLSVDSLFICNLNFLTLPIWVLIRILIHNTQLLKNGINTIMNNNLSKIHFQIKWVAVNPEL